MKNYYIIKYGKKDYKVFPQKEKYLNNSRLAVMLIDIEEDIPFGIITKNIQWPLSSNNEYLAFVDVNNFPNLENWLIQNNIAKPTGYTGFSGFCSYPEFEFNKDVFFPRTLFQTHSYD